MKKETKMNSLLVLSDSIARLEKQCYRFIFKQKPYDIGLNAAFELLEFTRGEENKWWEEFKQK